MAKEDFCFTYYDGDAARDMQHMDRVTRGAYNDLLIMQRKVANGRLTMSHIKAVLGSDFEKCWYSLEIILKKEGETFYIEWVDNSVKSAKEKARQKKEQIETYWQEVKEGLRQPPKNGRKKYKENTDEFKNKYISIKNEIPIENENENEFVIENTGGVGEKENLVDFAGPPLAEVERVFIQQGGTKEMALLFFNKHSGSNWLDQFGRPLKNWSYWVSNFIINFNKNNEKRKSSSGFTTAKQQQHEQLNDLLAEVAADVASGRRWNQGNINGEV